MHDTRSHWKAEPLVAIITIIVPVFLVLGAGYFAVRTGYLGQGLSNQLNAFAVRIAVPALLFNAMARLDFGQAFNLQMLASFYAGVVLCFALGIALARLIWQRRPGEAVAVGFTAMFSNTVLLGLPIIERAYGATVITPAFGIIALHASLIYVLGIASMELSRRDGKPLGETARDALRAIFANPLMAAILAGLAFNFSGLQMPAPLQATLDMLAAAAIPAALVGIGAAMTQYQIKSEIAESLMVSSLSLVIHPVTAFVLAHYLFGLEPEQVRAAVVLAAMPPGMNGYIFATMYHRAMALAASAILVATALSIGTISIWLALLDYLLL